MQKIKVNVTRFKSWSGNRRTDGRTETIALPPVLTSSVIRTFIRCIVLCTIQYGIASDSCYVEYLTYFSASLSVLGVTISSDLSLDQHVSKVCAAGFYRLRQLRHIRKSLDEESAITLVHAFVTSRLDYCNAVYAMSPQTITNRLQQRVMNAATRVISDTRKFDRGLTTTLHDELHWLDVPVPVSAWTGASVPCRPPHPSL